MKKFLTLGTIALVALAMGVSAEAEQPTRAALERKVTWQEQHIRQLNHRRDHLHRYIRHMRKTTVPLTTSSGGSSSSDPATSTSSTSSTPTYSGGVLSASQVASYARGAGFPESAISTMVAYASRESGFNPRAINSSSGACGLWQLYPCYGGSAWLDPATNARLAYQKYSADVDPGPGYTPAGFAPWGG